MSKLSHSNEPTMDIIERDARARESAESAAMAEAELRSEYQRFRADFEIDFSALTPPNFEEFKISLMEDNHE